MFAGALASSQELDTLTVVPLRSILLGFGKAKAVNVLTPPTALYASTFSTSQLRGIVLPQIANS